jgi:hypothetical protein
MVENERFSLTKTHSNKSLPKTLCRRDSYMIGLELEDSDEIEFFVFLRVSAKIRI